MPLTQLPIPYGSGGIADGDKGDITVSGSGLVWEIDAGTVTNIELADMATQTIKGRVTAGTGDPEDLTPTQGRTVLQLGTAALLNCTVSTSAPGSPAVNDLWVDTN